MKYLKTFNESSLDSKELSKQIKLKEREIEKLKVVRKDTKAPSAAAHKTKKDFAKLEKELSDLKKMQKGKLNESRIYGIEILPEDALRELTDYVDYKDPENKIEVVPDPRVDGTYAVRVYRKDFTFDLLWNRGAYDELEGFTNWPPTSGDLKFFF
jgi:uncharacterized protein YpbB